MKRTTPYVFYEFFVYPNYSDFCLEPNNIRRGFNAAVAAFQQADIMYQFYKRYDPSKIIRWAKKKDLLAYLGEREPYFLTIQSVATVYKHLYAQGAHYEVGSPMSLWGFVSSTGETEISGDSSEVHVRRRDGSAVRLRAALESVVCRMWPDVLPEEDWDPDS